MKVAFLNSFYPPDTAITGETLAEVVAHVRGRDPTIQIRVYASAAPYVDGARSSTSSDIEVVRFGPKRRSQGKVGRLLQTISVGRKMAREALAWADVIVSLTDPPLVGVWIGRQRRRAGRPVRWIEWTMDLFPEAFAAAKLVRKSNPIYRLISASQRKHLSDAYICLGEAQSKALRRLRGIDRPTVVLPCGIVEAPTEAASIPSWRQHENRIVIAYAGNVGEAHCPHFLPALVEGADPDRFAFLFSIYGIHAEGVRQRLRDRNNIHWMDRISHAELLNADVHAASLSADWTHVCVPSKAVTTVCLGRPLLFAGDPQSDTAEMLGRASWILPIPRDGRYDRDLIRVTLEEIADPEKRAAKAREARLLAETLKAQKMRALAEIGDLIAGRRA